MNFYRAWSQMAFLHKCRKSPTQWNDWTKQKVLLDPMNPNTEIFQTFATMMDQDKEMGQQKPTITFYLLRHGETDANSLGFIQGSSDFSRLTNLGRKQASDVAVEFFLEQNCTEVDSVFVSPLTRAQDTLSVIEDVLMKESQTAFTSGSSPNYNSEDSLGSIVTPNLREIDLYDWEGKHKSEIRENFPSSYQAWIEGDPENFTVTNANGSNDLENAHGIDRKPLIELWQRARFAWNEIHQHHIMMEEQNMASMHHDPINSHQKSKTCLIVSHGSLGQALLGTALGQDENFFRSHDIPNCGVIEIEWNYERFVLNPERNNISQKANKWRWRWPRSSEWNHV